MALCKLSNQIVSMHGKFAGVYFKHDNTGQHIQKCPRHVRGAVQFSESTFGPPHSFSFSSGIKHFSGCALLWLMALCSFYVASWITYAALHFLRKKNGKKQKMTGYLWYMYYAMMLPETTVQPYWKPPHSPGDHPSFYITKGTTGFYNESPTTWPSDFPADYYWPFMDYNGKPAFRNDDKTWNIWYKGPMYVVSKILGGEHPDWTYYGEGTGLSGWFINPATGKKVKMLSGFSQ